MAEVKVLTEKMLKDIQGTAVVDRGYVKYVDDITLSGVYRVDSAVVGTPLATYGMIIHIKSEGDVALLQLYITMAPTNQRIFMRTKWSVTDWSSWKELQV